MIWSGGDDSTKYNNKNFRLNHITRISKKYQFTQVF